MFDIIRGTFLLVVLLVMLSAIILVGGFCLYIAPIRYDWMIEHEMFKHAYGFAAITIFGEVAGLLFIRRGVMLGYEILQATFFNKEEKPCQN